MRCRGLRAGPAPGRPMRPAAPAGRDAAGAGAAGAEARRAGRRRSAAGRAAGLGGRDGGRSASATVLPAGRCRCAAAAAAGRAGAPGVGRSGGAGAGRGAPLHAGGGSCCAGRRTGRVPASVLTSSASLAGNASRSLRTTGASMVEDGDLTNSPMSVSFAMISLLVLPSSFASSCTRALPATALLRDEGWRPVGTARAPSSCVGCCSLLLHDVLTLGRPAFLSYWRLEDLPRVAERIPDPSDSS